MKARDDQRRQGRGHPGPGQALAVGFEGTRIPDDLSVLAERAGLGGVILFARNCPRLETVLTLTAAARRSEEHTSELQSPVHLVCRLLLEKKKAELEHIVLVLERAVTPN